MGNRRHKKASKSVLERSTVETVEKGTEDSIDKELTKKASNSNDEDTTGDTAEVSEKTNSKSDVSAATKEVTEDDDNNLPNEPDKSCVNNSKSNDQESLGVEVAKNVNGTNILDEIDDESKENESEVDNVKNIVNNINGDAEVVQQAPVLRLVAIEKLLKPDFMKEEGTVKASTSVKSRTLAKVVKTSSRSRKSISYVEISDSSENESIESINSSSDNEEGSKKQSGSCRKSGDLSSKENNSTNNILSDGKSKHDFNNPTIISPSKVKIVKSFTLNIEKMPTNVNKLMKVYKVNDKKSHDELTNSEPIDIWSESDDFENMITTSKIEKKSSDAEKNSKINANCDKEKSTRATRFNKTSNNIEFSNESNTNKKANIKGITKPSHKTKNDHLEVTTRTTRNSEKRASSSTSSRRKIEEDEVKEDSTAVIENNISKKSIRNRSNNIKDEPITSKSNLKVSTINIDDDDKESSDEILVDNSAIAPETRNKKRSPRKEKDDSDHSSCSNQNKVQNTKESSSKTSSSSDDEEMSEDEPPPILESRMRSREKYDKNADFISLKQTIALRKKKKLEEMEPKTKSKSIKSTDNVSKFKIPLKTNTELIVNKTNEQETTPKTENTEITQTNAKKNTVVNSPNADVKMEHNAKDNDSIKMATSKRTAANRKRLLSSSEEEEEEEVPKLPKKKKMSSDEEEDYNEEVEENGQSDEEESDDSDSSSKQKKKGNKSDDSNVDDDDDDDQKDVKSKRRKRIKEVASSNEDDDDKDSPSKGRKNIRKLMKGDKLDISTKEAAKLERERKQRIDERQKLYNQFYDERPEEVKEITKLVLDFNETTKKPLLQVHKKLVSKLKPHQANGIKFMWDACFESLERCNEESGSGAILAHCMGLGKTLQVITLIHTLLANSDKTNTTRILVVCPLSTILNWVNEFNIWFKDIEGSEDIYIYEINKLKQNADRANKLMEWHNDGGVMILSYDMFRNLTNDQGSRIRKKVRDSLQTSLLNPGPDLVICDEGHLLKNEKTSISKAMNRLTTLRRIVLTGTPLQNNLKEYYCMVQFVKPNLLGKYQEYMNRFVNPITNGQYTDSTAFDIQVMKRRSHVLHKLLNGCVQRRDYNVLAPFLPPKHEYVISIKMSPMQIKLYKFYMENRSRSNEEQKKGSILFQDFQNLQRIWTAPLVLRYNSDKYEQVQQKKRDNMDTDEESDGSLKDFIDDEDSAESTSDDSLESDNSDDEVMSINSDEPLKKSKKMKKKKNVPTPRRTRAMRAEEKVSEPEEEEPAIVERKDNPTEWWKQICPESELNNLEHASKLSLLMSILEECEAIGDKLLVFSQSLYSLDVIEHFLSVIDEQPQAKHTSTSYTGSWTIGRDYYRLDGSTPVEARNTACKSFNRKDNPRSRLFLISTRAGGLGINLVAANRVIIFDVSWNPSHDIQSIFRVYRFGQTKPCYVYRFLALGTMEEKIYERQVTKQAISKRVIDEQQIDRHYKENDLQELYNYDLEPDDERILPLLPKDRLFAEMLKKFEDMIYKYHEHDTLLENKEEETLNEEERKAAWEDFEAEKNRPQFVPYVQQQSRGIGPVTSNNIFGIRTDILLKLLSMKARLDNPTINDYEVKQVIPMLMQELYRQMDRGDLTLYQQLLALSSSLETPVNYGGQFVVNDGFHNQQRSMPSTSSAVAAASMGMYRQHLEQRTQQLQFQRNQQDIVTEAQNRYLNQKRPPPTINPTVIEID